MLCFRNVNFMDINNGARFRDPATWDDRVEYYLIFGKSS